MPGLPCPSPSRVREGICFRRGPARHARAHHLAPDGRHEARNESLFMKHLHLGILSALLALAGVGCTVHEVDAREPTIEGEADVEVSRGDEIEYESETDVDVEAEQEVELYGEADLYDDDEAEAEVEAEVEARAD